MESECRMLRSAMADLKKEIAKKSVTCTTSTSAEEEEEKEGTFEAIYVHSTETVIFNQYNPCARTSYYATTIFKNKNLLTNLRSSGTVTFTGMGGSIDVTQKGNFGDFGTVAYDERATTIWRFIANIIDRHLQPR